MSDDKEKEQQHSDLNDMPIFVLRYRTCSTILHLIAWMIGVLMFCVVFFKSPTQVNIVKEVFFRAGSIFCVLSAGFLLIDLIFFKEIRLYKDRIVKVWYIFGSRTIFLREAMLKGTNYVERWRKIYNFKHGFLMRYATVIFYIEDMATKEDAKMITILMAQVTGREEHEFEENRLNIKPILKELTK